MCERNHNLQFLSPPNSPKQVERRVPDSNQTRLSKLPRISLNLNHHSPKSKNYIPPPKKQRCDKIPAQPSSSPIWLEPSYNKTLGPWLGLGLVMSFLTFGSAIDI